MFWKPSRTACAVAFLAAGSPERNRSKSISWLMLEIGEMWRCVLYWNHEIVLGDGLSGVYVRHDELDIGCLYAIERLRRLYGYMRQLLQDTRYERKHFRPVSFDISAVGGVVRCHFAMDVRGWRPRREGAHEAR